MSVSASLSSMARRRVSKSRPPCARVATISSSLPLPFLDTTVTTGDCSLPRRRRERVEDRLPTCVAIMLWCVNFGRSYARRGFGVVGIPDSFVCCVLCGRAARLFPRVCGRGWRGRDPAGRRCRQAHRCGRGPRVFADDGRLLLRLLAGGLRDG